MAYTVSHIADTVYGNHRVKHLHVVADAGSGTVATGLNFVYGLSLTPHSMASTSIRVRYNADAASAAANGSVNVASAASGDEFYLTVYGK